MIASSFGGRAGERYAVSNLSIEFADLSKRAAEGDLAAARTLFEELQACAPATARSPQAAMALMERHVARRRQGEHRGADGSIVMARAMLQRCSGITDEQLATRARWGERLASAGDRLARLQYVDYAVPSATSPDYPQRLAEAAARARSFLDPLVASGDAQALFAYGHYWNANRLVPRDPYRAYVHLHAYALAGIPEAHPAFSQLAALGTQLSAEERSTAEREGLALYTKCCGG
jgi:hypothetical protein